MLTVIAKISRTLSVETWPSGERESTVHKILRNVDVMRKTGTLTTAIPTRETLMEAGGYIGRRLDDTIYDGATCD